MTDCGWPAIHNMATTTAGIQCMRCGYSRAGSVQVIPDAMAWGQCELCGINITEDEAEEVQGPYDEYSVEVCATCAEPWRS